MSSEDKGKIAEIPQSRSGKFSAGAREKRIVRTSVIGIIANVFLAVFKFIAGSLSGSVSITLDAVNNLSDSLSSLITIIGTRLAAKPADKKHPFGYGRTEYLSATVISAIVLYAGFTALKESIDKIIHPANATYGVLAFTILAVAIAVKIMLSVYVKKVGKETESKSLLASGADAGFDAVLSASVLGAAVLYQFTGISIEAYVGIAISVIILKSGFDMLRDTLDDILGSRLDPELSRKVKAAVEEHEGVFSAHDLVLHSYGPSRLEGSVHIEVLDTMTAKEIDRLTIEITVDVFRRFGVVLSGIGIYSRNSTDPEIAEMETSIHRVLEHYPDFLDMHGFYIDQEQKTMKFDIILSYAEKEDARKANYNEICEKVRSMYPDYQVFINLDADISD